MKTRFWDNKLSNIDHWLCSIYDTMSKSDQKKKDASNHQYYRYFNDGDIPRNLRTTTGSIITRWTAPSIIEAALERKVEENARYFIKKYMTAENRKKFYIEEGFENINAALRNILDKKSYEYWINKCPISRRYGQMIKSEVEKIQKLSCQKIFDRLANEIIEDSDRYVRSYVIDQAIMQAESTNARESINFILKMISSYMDRAFDKVCYQWSQEGNTTIIKGFSYENIRQNWF